MNVLLPVDHVVAAELRADAETEIVSEIAEGKMGLDIGPETVATYAEALSKAGTIFWNGPMGVFEMEAFSIGRRASPRPSLARRATPWSVAETPRPPSISLDLMTK